MNALERLEPSIVWKHFNDICSIPHISKCESKLVKHIQSLASQWGLESHVDEVGNLIVWKPPTNKNSSSITLQSHLDMVPQKNETTIHDFELDPIQPYVDGNYVKAKGTTLGADNGIGVAVALAVLESKDLSHGQIEALFTIDEETGMTGALGLKPGILKSRKMINLDTEEEGQFYIGCAGGVNCSAELVCAEEQVDKNYIAFTIALKGLKGGHSGIDVNSGRGNAVKLLNRVLFSGTSLFSLRISKFSGGTVRNAIPREAFATIIIPETDKQAFISFVGKQEKELINEYAGAEDSIEIKITGTDVPASCLSLKSQENLMHMIYACPNGVIRMSSKIPDVVETSNNLAILDYQNGKAQVHCLLRSLTGSAIKDLENTLCCTLTLAGAHVEFSGGYPGWEPEPDSNLLKTMTETYESITNRKPEVKVVHAGLECGIIGSKYPDMEIVSCGPTIQFPHSPDERLEISSVNEFWRYLVKLLEVV